MCSHLQRRNAVYYTRLVVPLRLRPIIGRSDLGRSLRTKDRAEALRLLPHWLAEARATLAAAEAELDAQASAPAASAPAFPDPIAAMSREEFEGWQAHQAEELRASIAEDDAEAKLALPEPRLAPEDAAAARLLRRARLERDNYRERYRARKERDQQQAHSHKEPTFWVRPQSVGTSLVGDSSAAGETSIVDLWAAERKPREKTIDAHKALARWFHGRIGVKPVDQIAKADVLAFKAALIEEGQSTANIKTKLSRLRTLLQYAADNGFISANPAKGVTVKVAASDRTKRRPFDLPALKAIFDSPVFAKGERPTRGRGEAAYWLPLLALFTGARLEELGQLRPDDVRRLTYPDPDGNEQAAWFLHLVEVEGDEEAGVVGTELKNAASERLVPIHPELERLGFIRFAQAMKAAGHARIFHQLRPNKYGTLTAKWGEWWSVYRREVCGITDKRMVFHSFRHTFKDYARHAGMDEGVQRQIMGHSGEDVADDYGSGHSLYRVVEGMKLYRIPGLRPLV